MTARTASGALILCALFVACGPSGAEPTDESAPVAAATPQRHHDCSLLGGVGPRLAAVDNSFGPDCFTVRSDATLHVQNFGDFEHSFTISEDKFGTKPFRIDVNLPSGRTKPVELTDVLEVGTYEFFCTFHGGMDGVLEIVAPVTG